MTLSGISAAVLIGGHSRRMGTPKALLRLDEGGETLLERAVASLDAIATDVVLVGRPPWPLPESLTARRIAADRGTSAADGVVAALESATHRFCLVVACDMPFLDGALLAAMASQAVGAGRGVLVVDAEGAHPLHAVWDAARRVDLEDAIAHGERSLGALARLAGMETIDLAAPGRLAAERWSVFNVNTPADLARARAHAGSAG
jgi:molybdopterin-guanine dinucleotide biosynthesis protein A